ncbi:MAG: hypothetical protein HFG79_15605 [Lachnospiraceae bacterium]|jgi:hypothetical protein|nr:hypothetical protein [Lachnospiraceae bacterium]
MSVYEVLILLAGLIFFVASFFFGGKKSAGEEVDTDAEIRKIKEAAVLHEGEIRERLNALLSQECGTAIDDVKEKLSEISNDKIMAVDEYAGQVLARIENNNQSVVFLYDMLQKKEDEMKSTMNKMEQTRRENRELFDRLEELKQAKARVASRNAAKQAGAKQKAGNEVLKQTKSGQAEKDAALANGENLAGHETQEAEGTAHEAVADLSHTQAEALTKIPHSMPGEDLEQEQEKEEGATAQPDRQEQVLALYRENISVKDISKKLAMGQGEVKLIIDLYAKK